MAGTVEINGGVASRQINILDAPRRDTNENARRHVLDVYFGKLFELRTLRWFKISSPSLGIAEAVSKYTFTRALTVCLEI